MKWNEDSKNWSSMAYMWQGEYAAHCTCQCISVCMCVWVCECVSDKIHYTFAHFSISFTSTVHGRAGYGGVLWPARRDAFALTAAATGHGQPHCTRAATSATSSRAGRRGRRVAVPTCICWVCVCVRLMVLICDMVLVLLMLLVVHVCRFLVVLLLVVVVVVVANGSRSHARRGRLPQTVRVIRNVEAVCAMRNQIDLLARRTHTRAPLNTICSLFIFELSFMCFCGTCCSANCLSLFVF